MVGLCACACLPNSLKNFIRLAGWFGLAWSLAYFIMCEKQTCRYNMMPILEASFCAQIQKKRTELYRAHNANVPFNSGFLLIFHISFTHRMPYRHSSVCVYLSFLLGFFFDFCSLNVVLVV